MAQIASAKTRIKRNKKREIVNSTRRSAVRTDVKKFQKEVAAASDGIVGAFKRAVSSLARAAQCGAFSKKAASRKTSRLAKLAKKSGAK